MKILYMVRPFFGPDHQIIDIALDCFVEYIIKNYLHRPLVSCSCILKSEGHHFIAKNALRCAESCGLLIFWCHQNLIVTCFTLHEWQRGMPCSWVNHEFCDRQQEIIFWTSVIEISEFHTNTKLPIFIPSRHDVCDPCCVLDLVNESCLYEFVNLFFNFRYQL